MTLDRIPRYVSNAMALRIVGEEMRLDRTIYLRTTTALCTTLNSLVPRDSVPNMPSLLINDLEYRFLHASADGKGVVFAQKARPDLTYFLSMSRFFEIFGEAGTPTRKVPARLPRARGGALPKPPLVGTQASLMVADEVDGGAGHA